jgi:hypothetical protein
MKVKRTLFVAMWSVVLCWAVGTCQSQETAKPQADVYVKPLAPPAIPYHLEFALIEMQDGKRINTRHYSMNLNGDYNDQIKIGTRVPVEIDKQGGQIQYMDVGTDIWSRLEMHQNSLVLQVKAEISNFALPDKTSNPGERPILRQLSIRGSTVPTLGKAVSIGSLDDPNSNHQFQLEVTVTQIR